MWLYIKKKSGYIYYVFITFLGKYILPSASIFKAMFTAIKVVHAKVIKSVKLLYDRSSRVSIKLRIIKTVEINPPSRRKIMAWILPRTDAALCQGGGHFS